MSTTTRNNNRRRRRNAPEASYDEASRARYRTRAGIVGNAASDDSLFGRRFKVLFVVMGFIAIVILGFLFFYQVINQQSLAKGAEENRKNVIPLHAKRGTIYDRNGNVLAMSVDCKDIYCNPKEIKDPAGVAQVLADSLGGKPGDYLEALKKDTTFSYIKRQADKTASAKVKAALEEKKLAGVYYVDNTKRVYPYGNVGVQILGYVGSDGKGISGLEYYYDKELSGEDGSMIMETGLGGTPIAGGSSQVTEAKNGKDIVLSLDINLQDEAEKQLTQAVKDNDAKDGGSLLAMNPKNGEIYAACSYPLPDFSGKTDLDPDSLNLKLVSNSYEPGSVFKVVTTAIGMENTLFGPNSTFNVPLTIDVGGHIVEDDDWRSGAMDMTVTEMMRRSSNVGMATLETQVIGDKRFAQGLEDLGIGQATGIDFPGEADGIVKPIDKYESYTGGNMSFGQGLAIPFIQVTRVYAAVANGGNLVTPHFATSIGGKDIDWPVKEGVLSKTTCDGEKEMLRTVIREGTGVRAQVSGYDIAGKTGTGQQVDKKTSAYDNSGHYVSSLCGFANADDPDVLVYAGLNDTQQLASQSAAVVFSTFMKSAVTHLEIPPASQ